MITGTNPVTDWRIGDFVLHADRHELVGPGGAQRLPPRLTALLLALAATPGRTVTRDTLLTTVWSRKVLNDEVLSRSIADLRAALRDDAREPRYVETIPKLGYRLLAAVAPLEPSGVGGDGIHRHAGDGNPDGRSDGSRDRRSDAHPDDATNASFDKPHPAIAPRRPSATELALAFGLALAAALALWLAQGSPPPPPPAATVAPAPSPLTPAAIAAARPLTSDPGWELTPRFSPDGVLVAYASAQVDTEHSVVVLQTRDGIRQREIGADDPAWHHCPVFSPDGRDLIWLRISGGGCLLLREPVAGGPRRELALCAPRMRSCPDWSSDGATLLFTAPPRGAERGAGIAALDLASGRVTALTDPPLADGHDTEPRAVPGGASIAFTRGTEWGRRLLIRAPDASVRVLRTDRYELAYGHDWLPDGSAAVYAADALGQRALLALAPSGAVELLGALGARFPDLAPDGSLVYELARYDANLWALRPGTSAEPLRLTRSTRYESHPTLSPDGTHVAFQSNRDGRDVMYRVAIDGSDEQRLPLDPAYRWVRANWLPDGSGMLLSRYGPDGTDIWRWRFAGETPEPLAGFGAGHYDARYDETGGWLYAMRDTPAGRALVRAPGTLGEPAVEIVAAPVDRYIVLNGRLAYSRADGSDVVLCRADGAGCRPSGAGLAAERRGAWDLSNDALYFAGRGPDGRAALMRLPLDGSTAAAPVATLVPNTIGPSLAVSADESLIVVAHNDDLAIDLMIVEAPRR